MGVSKESVINSKDPRLVSVEHLNLVNTELFTNPDLQMQALNMFGTRTYYISEINKENMRCFDPARSYSQNFLGYRGAKEFDSRVDLIATGCSQTFGLGIDEDAMWSKRMAQGLKMSYATIASPGWSVQEMVSSVMAYIRKYGKPKVIAALLPDFGRIMSVEHSQMFLPESTPVKQKDLLNIKVRGFHHDGSHFQPKLSKTPHSFMDVFPTEAAIYIAAQTWASFIEYCRVAEIALVWTSWEQSILDMYSMLSELVADPSCNPQGVIIDTTGFVSHNISIFDEYSITNLKDAGCHQELKKLWPDSFDFGTDSCKHYGAHAHAHIAEMLAKKYLEF